MSTKYKHGDTVPTKVLSARLNELADVVARKRDRIGAEFTLRIPAELDRDADCVLSEAANRLNDLTKQLSDREEQVKALVEAVLPLQNIRMGHIVRLSNQIMDAVRKAEALAPLTEQQEVSDEHL